MVSSQRPLCPSRNTDPHVLPSFLILFLYSRSIRGRRSDSSRVNPSGESLQVPASSVLSIGWPFALRKETNPLKRCNPHLVVLSATGHSPFSLRSLLQSSWQTPGAERIPSLCPPLSQALSKRPVFSFFFQGLSYVGVPGSWVPAQGFRSPPTLTLSLRCLQPFTIYRTSLGLTNLQSLTILHIKR